MMEYRNYSDSNIVEISLQGNITEADFDQAIAKLKVDIETRGKLRILEEIHSFEGLDPITFWKDLRFGLAHIDDFTHAAVVADAKWMRTFAEAINTVLFAEVRAFEPSQIEAARAWLQTAPDPSEILGIVYESANENSVVEIVIEGKVTAADYERLIPQIEADIANHGKLKVLEEIRSFEGLDPLVLWKNLQQLPMVNNFTHAALVTDAQWMQTTATAVGVLMPFEVKAFERSQIEAARTWLASA